MFGGDGTPEDLVFGGDKTPREQASAESVDQSDYDFARPSAIGNAGEDLIGSARHKRNQWRSLEDAEKDGTAEKMITREQLLKNEPHNLMDHLQKSPAVAMAMHLALKKFPPKPGYKRGRSNDKEDRKDYVEAFRKFKSKAESIASSGQDDVTKAVRDLGTEVSNHIKGLRTRKIESPDGTSTIDRYNSTANGLCSFGNSLLSTYKRNSVASIVNNAAAEIESNPSMSLEDVAGDVLEGKSLNQAMGKKGKSAERFDASKAYVAIAEREGGPEMPAKTANEATAYLVEKVGLRGIQFGNSVSDKERQHHATKAAEALLDLADVTGLPLEAISLGGNLGLAMGARGTGSALAHYEPVTKVINLTRKSGVGSLAHEWAHAFDHELGKDSDKEAGPYGKSGFQSDLLARKEYMKSEGGKYVRKENPNRKTETGKAMMAMQKASSSSGYAARLSNELDNNKMMSLKQKAYWRSDIEVFARSFERYVQHKLESSGRKNTYLSGIETKSYKSGGLWPTDDEVKKMTPAFDALMDAHRTENLKVKDRAKYSAADRHVFIDQFIAEHYRALNPSGGGNERKKIVTGNEGDRGYFVTISGHPVFVETKSGKVTRGPKSHRGKHVKSVAGDRLHKSKRIKTESRKGDRDSPGQTGAFGNGLGGDLLRSGKTQSKLPSQDGGSGNGEGSSGSDSSPNGPKRGPGDDRFVAANALDHAAIDIAGSDDPIEAEHARDLLDDAHTMLANEANEINDDFRNLLSNFGFSGRKAGTFIASVRRNRSQSKDHSSIAGFDEMVEMAKRDFPQLIGDVSGTGSVAGDADEGLYQRLLKGYEKPPTKTDERVIGLAREMFESNGKPNKFDDDHDISWMDDWNVPDDQRKTESVPFSATSRHDFIMQHYQSKKSRM